MIGVSQKRPTKNAALLLFNDHLRRRLTRFELCAHLLDLRRLLLDGRGENFHSRLLLHHRGLQLGNGRLLLLHFAVFFKKLIE